MIREMRKEVISVIRSINSVLLFIIIFQQICKSRLLAKSYNSAFFKLIFKMLNLFSDIQGVLSAQILLDLMQ